VNPLSVESWLSPLPVIVVTSFLVMLIARKLSGGSGVGVSNAGILQRLAKLEREVHRLKQGAGSDEPDPLDAEARQIAQTKGTIEAIKYVRAQTGMGLKDAKDYVEGLAGKA
jgi:ribosomal protein L7/L12